MNSIFLFVLALHANTDDFDRYFEQRRQEMEKLIQKFDQSFRSDDFFQAPTESFQAARSEAELDIKKEELSNGDIEVTVTPKDNTQKLVIKTQGTQIMISSEKKVEETVTSEQGTSRSQSTSFSSHIVSIPEGYKANAPKKNGQSFVILLKQRNDYQAKADF